ncbi:MAG: GNAT family N-acetyltransferase [Oscillospiraceae bacterium]|jgi:RimJ/RimL family protein N-acetyltransferase|nr:GNAT family N-acetyltransferase [Oscillospiraceae bacterium]
MKSSFPQLQTPRLCLREMTKADAPTLVELLRNQEVSRWLTVDLSRMTRREEEIRIARARKAFAAGRELHWGIGERDSDGLVGMICLVGLNRRDQHAMAGFWLGHAYWGRGYMTEALWAVLDYSFRGLGLNRVYAGHFADNSASGRVMQKCGLQYEGTRRQAFCKNGQYYDEMAYAILKSDYEHLFL